MRFIVYTKKAWNECALANQVLPARSDAPAITAVLQLGTLALLTNLHQAVACTGKTCLLSSLQPAQECW